MPSKRRMKNRRRYQVPVIVLVILATVLLLTKEFDREETLPGTVEEGRQEKMPEVAVIIDDLGPSKSAAQEIFSLNIPLTLSIIPRERYSEWIAGEGHGLGYEVIAHIPMEAQTPQRLGAGGLYTWMTEDEIRETLEESFDSLPHVKGVSNHMGSSFTADERVMRIFISVIREHGLFFLDSLTHAKSFGEDIAREQGVAVLKRDVFLDAEDSPDAIREQWNRLVEIAEKRGYAIVLAHPRKNTIRFLNEVLPSKKVKAVPLTKISNAR